MKKQILLAISEDNEELLLSLIKNGANINETLSNEEEPSYCHIAISRESPKCLKILLENKAKQVPAVFGFYPIHSAAYRNNLDCLKILVENGENMERRNQMKETPLLLTACYCHYKCMKYLLEKGADPFVKDWSGHTVLDRLGKKKNSKECIDLYNNHVEMIKNKKTQKDINNNENKNIDVKKVNYCNTCKKESKLKCGACKMVYYCSKECQTIDWKSHKSNCNKY